MAYAARAVTTGPGDATSACHFGRRILATVVWLMARPCSATPPEAAPAALDPVAEPTAVVVTATRHLESAAELPVAIDRLDQTAIRTGQLEVNLSESLSAVPGLSIQNRQNYAQDLQLSLRGFGARSSFGVRGVRLYADSIPGTMPDGQGQFSHFDLGGAARIEVLRGPFSALYGNSSGGVIAIFTADGVPGSELAATAAGGSLGTQRYSLQADGDSGAINYLIDAAHFATDGYREHSAAERNTANLKVRYRIDDDSRVTIVGNLIRMPDSLDPLGLSRAQLADPTAAGTNAVAYDTRKSLEQQQLGINWERAFDSADEIAATAYTGSRATTQYQAILKPAEARTALHPGGVIDLDRTYWGIDLHGLERHPLGEGTLQLTAGIAFDELLEARRGYLNYVGNLLGVEGALRRDEANTAWNLDEYLEARWNPTPALVLLGGVRNNLVRIDSLNRLPAGPPGAPASSSVSYAALDPVAGLSYRLSPATHLYAAFGNGFETPTLNDLAYRSTDGSLPGLNTGLMPARSEHVELGLKTARRRLSADAAVFAVKTRHELAVAQSVGGRSVYANIDETHRVGTELGLEAALGDFSLRTAYSWLRAVTAEPYQTCVGLPCTSQPIPAGRRLPAVPAHSGYAGLSWRHAHSGFAATLEAQARASIEVDDRNSDAAPGYWVSNLRAGFEQVSAGWRCSEFLHLDNLADRRYVGSVIVNDSNGRFFEPAPGRTAYLIFSAAHR
jgi:iron complex outermembrane recepter protein